jgi:hypothetical protein
VAAAFFKRADYAWAARGPAAETAWLLGPTGCDAFDALEPAPPQWLPSRLFQVGGCAVMQGGWERDAHQLLLDAGPLGCRVSGGHGHADLLSIQCSVFGRPQLVDPGTYCYTAHLNWRDHFRGSAAHNTVVIDRKSQAVSNGPFSWRRRPQAQLRRWISSPSFDYAEADHDAYRRLPDPVRHRRRVLFVKPRYWVVVDDLLGDDVHQVDLSFQFRPGALAEAGDGWMRATGPEGRGLLVRAFAATPLQVETHEGCVEPIRGWMSPDYGLRVPAPQLVYTALEQLPLRIVTLLVPLDDGVPPPQAILVPATDGVNLMFGDAQETIRVGDRQITVACTGRPDIVPLDAE